MTKQITGNYHSHMDTIAKKGLNKVLVITNLIFIALVFWWIFVFLTGTKDAPVNHIFGFVYGGFSLWGGICGFIVSKRWGGMKSKMGKAILFLSLGLLCQAFGQYSFWVYNYVFHVAVPYPGIPDIGYFGTIPFYIYAAILLAEASGVHLTLDSIRNKLQILLISLLILSISYYLFLKDYSFQDTTPLQVLLDFGYPLGQAVYISIAALTFSLTRGILGGVMRSKVFLILLAFLAQYLAEFIFIYFHDLYFPASFIDLFYLIAYFVMTFAILKLNELYWKLRS